MTSIRCLVVTEAVFVVSGSVVVALKRVMCLRGPSAVPRGGGRCSGSGQGPAVMVREAVCLSL